MIMIFRSVTNFYIWHLKRIETKFFLVIKQFFVIFSNKYVESYIIRVFLKLNSFHPQGD